MIATLTGNNSFLLQEQLRLLVSAFVKAHGDLALERLDGEETEFERIREGVQSLPFLASRKMVVLRSPGAHKQFVENIDALLEAVPETTDLIIVEPKLDKRSGYYKTLKAKTDYKEFKELDGQGLARWLSDTARNQGGELSVRDGLYLVERVGTNQQLLRNELDKLLNYSPKISRETIDLLTERTPQSTVFELLDAAFTGHAKRALSLYAEQRAMKVEPLAIIAMIAWQLHVLAILKVAEQRSMEDIAATARINPYVLRKSRSIADRLTLQELKDLIAEVLELDIALKSKSIDPDEALQNLLLSISRQQ